MSRGPWRLHPARQGRRSVAFLLLTLGGGCSGSDTLPRTLEARLSERVAWEPCADRAGGSVVWNGCGGGPADVGDRLSRADRGSIPWVAGLLSRPGSADLLENLVESLQSSGPGDREVALALGALEHARFSSDGEPYHLLGALEWTTRALAAGAGAAARFNRALILGDLGACRVARRAWSRYLEHDDPPAWRREAEKRRARLPCVSRRAGNANDQRFRLALDRELARWSDSIDADPGRARDVADGILATGRDLELATGDPTIRMLGEDLSAVAGSGGRERVESLEAYSRGRTLFLSEDVEDSHRLSRSAFESALTGLRRSDSVLADWAEVWLASLDVFEGRFFSADLRMEALSADGRRSMLAGRVERTLGWSALRQGLLESSRYHFRKAEKILDGASFDLAAAAVRTMTAETLATLGDLIGSWKPRHSALRLLQSTDPRSELHNVLLEGSEAAQRLSSYAAADAYLLEARLIARELRSLDNRVEYLLWQAQSRRRRGRHGTATALFRRALVKAQRRNQPRFVHMAKLGLWEDPRVAAEESSVESDVAFFARHGPPAMLLQALTSMARKRRESGDLESASAAISRAIEVILEQRHDVREPESAVSFLDSARGVFDEAVTVFLDRGDAASALAALEAAREYPDLDGDWRAVAHAVSLAGSLDPRSPVVVVLARLREEYVWWAIDRGELTWGRGSGGEVSAAAESVLRALPSGAAADEELQLLYDRLFSRALGSAGDRPLIVVPDGPFQRIPFAALVAGGNSRNPVRLIEVRPVSLRWNLRHALAPSETPKTARRDWRAVVVGNPDFDRARFDWLGPLPATEREADLVASRYGTVPLNGPDATLSRIRSVLPGKEVLHLAAHSYAGPRAGGEGFLLAREGRRSGIANPRELLQGRLDLQLAVLSGCSTLGVSPSRAGGLLGMAREFSIAGVPATVGTLWPIEDRAMVELMDRFHDGVRAGLAASRALQRAQQAVLRRDGGNQDWAAVQVIGDLAPDEGAPGGW